VRACIAALAATLILCLAIPAAAQTKPPAAKKQKEFTLGLVVPGPSSLGETTAELLNGSGAPSLTLMRSKNSLGWGFGLETNIGWELKRSLWLEASGSWTRTSLTSDIREDVEDATGDEVSSPVSRFVLEGAMLKYFREKGTSAWFVRLDGGWMRETAGGATLTGDGFIGGGGLGYRKWFKTTGKGGVKRMGMRFEARALVRSGGLSLGEDSVRIGPGFAAHIVWGF
jgi:hypothetical protein